MNAITSGSVADDTVSPRDIVAILLRRKWRILVTLLLVVAGTLLMPKR
jgi:uncharacterized protein involved in exopolysaccharide biosynthesis